MVKTVTFQAKKQLYIVDTVRELNELTQAGVSVIPEYHYAACEGSPDEKNIQLSDYDSEGVLWPHTDHLIVDFEQVDNEYLYRIYQRLNNEPWIILKTEHFIVRETTVSDVDDFYRIYSEPSITEYIEPLFDNPENERLYTRNYIKDIYGFYGFGMWSVIDKSTNVVVGRAGVSMIDGYDYPELGFLMDNAYQHKGYTFEVVSAIMEYSKNELEFSTIQARVKPDNLRSIKLLERLGFNIPHTLHQEHLIALHTFA